MDISRILANQVSDLQQAASLSVMKMAQTTDAAQAVSLLTDFASTQANVKAAPHPTLGQSLDVRV